MESGWNPAADWQSASAVTVEERGLHRMGNFSTSAKPVVRAVSEENLWRWIVSCIIWAAAILFATAGTPRGCNLARGPDYLARPGRHFFANLYYGPEAGTRAHRDFTFVSEDKKARRPIRHPGPTGTRWRAETRRRRPAETAVTRCLWAAAIMPTKTTTCPNARGGNAETEPRRRVRFRGRRSSTG